MRLDNETIILHPQCFLCAEEHVSNYIAEHKLDTKSISAMSFKLLGKMTDNPYWNMTQNWTLQMTSTITSRTR